MSTSWFLPERSSIDSMRSDLNRSTGGYTPTPPSRGPSRFSAWLPAGAPWSGTGPKSSSGPKRQAATHPSAEMEMSAKNAINSSVTRNMSNASPRNHFTPGAFR